MLDHTVNLTPNFQLTEIWKMAKREGKIYDLFRDFHVALSLYLKAKSSLTFVFPCNYQEIINQEEQVSQLSFVSVG